MADPNLYTYPSPLANHQSHPQLPTTLNPDGKSYQNPPATKQSPSYQHFTDGITNGPRGAFDVHIYYLHTSPVQTQFAKDLWTRIRIEFPELRIYKIWDRPIGPHSRAMFEVNVFTPAQFGAFVPWLVINRGMLSVLVHCNTEDEGEEERNHTQRAVWLGERVELELGVFEELAEKRRGRGVGMGDGVENGVEEGE